MRRWFSNQYSEWQAKRQRRQLAPTFLQPFLSDVEAINDGIEKQQLARRQARLLERRNKPNVQVSAKHQEVAPVSSQRPIKRKCTGCSNWCYQKFNAVKQSIRPCWASLCRGAVSIRRRISQAVQGVCRWCCRCVNTNDNEPIGTPRPKR